MTGRLGRNFLYLVANNVLSPLFSIVLVLAISRLQGIELLGQYSLLMTTFILGQSVGTLGLTIVLTREVAQAHDDAGHWFVNASAVTGIIIGAGLVMAWPIAGWALDEPEMRTAFRLVLLTFIPSIVMSYGEAIVLALERAGHYVIVGLAENLLRASVGAALVVAGYGIVALASVILLTRLGAMVGMLGALARLGVSLRSRIDLASWRSLLAHVPVTGAIPIVNQVYARADVFLLSYFGTWADVGIYSAGLRLVDLARTLPPAFGKALYPVLARLHGDQRAEFDAVARRGLRQSIQMIAPATFVLSAFATPLIHVVFGDKAAGAEHSLAVLAWSLIPLGAACALAQVLFAAGRQSIDLRVNVIATAVSLSLNLLLIPRFGAVGAAWAMVLSTSLYAALQYFWVDREIVALSSVDYVAKTAAVVLAATVLVWSTDQTNTALGAVLGVAVLIGGSLVMGVITRDDLERLRSLVGGRRWLWGTR